MMKKVVSAGIVTLCYVVLFSCICLNLVAQPTLLSMPAKYHESPDGDLVDGRTKSSRYFWTVFSDRDDNGAYDIPSDNGTPISTVSFMEKFYVTGESGDFLEVYRWSDDAGLKIQGAGGKTQLNPKKAVRVGWIPKERLLLWWRCLEDKNTHFAKKAMAVVSAKNLDAEFRKDNSLRIFSGPDVNKENRNTIKMFNFLYVYKSTGARVLIGKNWKTNTYNADRDILGWVDTIFLQQWPDRVCLVPNAESGAVSERKGAAVKTSLFYDKEDLVTWKQGKAQKAEACWDDDTYEKPWLPSRQRFPIFKTDDDLVYTGFTTDLYKEGSNMKEKVMSSTDLDDAEQKLQQLLKKARNINVVFVIDAGFGMSNYASAISNSLKQLIRKKDEMNKEGANRNSYKYGMVVYRSVNDKVCPDGNLSLNKYPLTSNASQVLNFLSKEFTNEGCSNDMLNKNTGKALLEALNMIKDDNKEDIKSNYIFFIGGATGDKTPELETLPGLIAKYDVSLSVFQVQSITDPVEFERFPDHFNQILGVAKEKKYALTDARFRRGAIGMKTVEGQQNLFKLDFPTTSPIQGNINFPNKGETIPAPVIDDILDQTIKEYENELENGIDKTKAVVTGLGNQKTEGAELNAVVRNLLNRLGKAVNNYDLVRKFNGRNVQFFVPAWTSPNVNRLERPVFKYVLYVTEDELTDMIDKFERLIEEAPPSDLRDMMYDAYETLAQAYFGKEILNDDKFQSKLSIDEIISKITGLPSSSELLKETKLSDIKDTRKISDDRIEEIRKRIKNSYDQLRLAKNDLNGTVRFPTDDGTYYWILQDYLP